MVGIIILNYNNPAITIKCFESIERFNTAPCKYIFVDNASTDDSVQILDSYFMGNENSRYVKYVEGDAAPEMLSEISFVEAKRNTGYACGNNLGCYLTEKDKSIDKILILNNDILFMEDIIPSMSAFMDSHPEAAIVSVLLMEKAGGEFKFNSARRNCTVGELFAIYAHWSDLQKKFNRKRQIFLDSPELISLESLQIELPVGACMLIDRSVFESIGYFDPHTFLYYEENILYKKIRKINKKIYILPRLKVIHTGGTTIKKTKFSYFQEIQKSRSAYYYGMHYSGMSFFLKPLFWLVYQYHLCRLKMRLLRERINNHS